MFYIDFVLLLVGALLLMGILSSKVTAKVGIPGLVLFLVIGMMAGSEGVGGVAFQSFEVAHAVGTLALALILFDGGLRTPFRSIRRAWKPAGLLATVGVLMTASVTAVAAVYVVGVSWPVAFLLGSIISSTDAAAVFAVLRKQGLQLEERLASTVEIESGANDPMAVFLTIVFIEVIQGEVELGLAVGMMLVLQFGVGAVVGVLVGGLGARLINRIKLDAAGLYPVLATALAFLAFGVAAQFGGSGFLAVYVAGLLIGNQRVVYQRGIYLVHDAGAWTAQIVMFTMLGLLIFPSQVMDVSVQGALLAAALTFVARPITVFCLMPFFRFSWREMVFLSWAGLKGAVPIILAIYPLLFGLEEGRLIFNVVFFVVLFSAMTQGWSLPMVARRLGLQKGEKLEPRIQLELLSLEHVEADLVEYHIEGDSPVCERLIREIPLPDEVHIALVAREKHIIPSKGGTRIQEEDYVFVIHPRRTRPLLDRLFAGMSAEESRLKEKMTIEFDSAVKVESLRTFYQIELPEEGQKTLGELVGQNDASGPIADGDFTYSGDWVLTVHTSTGEKIDLVGMRRRG